MVLNEQRAYGAGCFDDVSLTWWSSCDLLAQLWHRAGTSHSQVPL
jgi:hypothetical protein